MKIDDIINEDNKPGHLSPMALLRRHRDKERQLANRREEYLSVEHRWREFLEKTRRHRHLKALWRRKLMRYRKAVADDTVEEYLSRL